MSLLGERASIVCIKTEMRRHVRQKVKSFQFLGDYQKSSTADATVNRRLNKAVDSCGERE